MRAFSRPEGPHPGYSLAWRNVPYPEQGYSLAWRTIPYPEQGHSFARPSAPYQDQGHPLVRPNVPYRDQGYSRPKGPSSVPMSLSTAPVAMYLTPGCRVPLWNLPQSQTPPTPTRDPTATTATTDIPRPTMPPPLGGGPLPSLPWGAP